MNAPEDLLPRQQFSERLHRLETIREKRAYERRVLPFFKTIVDFDIGCEIGYHQLAGCPLTVKQLLLVSLAPPATVMRRLDRLCALGIVERKRSPRDGRVHELLLAREVIDLMADSVAGIISPLSVREDANDA
jgi:DNA-binding MarR family transcriptional regulator